MFVFVCGFFTNTCFVVVVVVVHLFPCVVKRSFEELLEGLARCADAWDVSTSNFEQKLTRFLTAFCKGLRL